MPAEWMFAHSCLKDSVILVMYNQHILQLVNVP